MRRPSDRRPAAALVVGVLLTVAAGCVSSRTAPVDPARIDEAVAELTQPLPADMAALYDLRVPRSSGLRLTVLNAGDAGRFSVSEPFGSALSITAWSAVGPAGLLDLENGCRRSIDELDGIAGVGALPVRQAASLLGGRLPAAAGDKVLPGPDGVIAVRGAGWAALVRIQADPWRVVEVREVRADGRRGWRIRLDDHAGSVPGRLHLVVPGTGRAELVLKRIEWRDRLPLPDLPDLPRCARRPR